MNMERKRIVALLAAVLVVGINAQAEEPQAAPAAPAQEEAQGDENFEAFMAAAEMAVEGAKKVEAARASLGDTKAEVDEFMSLHQNEVATALGVIGYANQVQEKSWELAKVARIYAQLRAVDFVDRAAEFVGGDNEDTEAIARYMIPSVEVGLLGSAFRSTRGIGKWKKQKVINAETGAATKQLVQAGRLRRLLFFGARWSGVGIAVPVVIDHSQEIEAQLEMTEEGYNATVQALEERMSQLTSEIASLKVQTGN